MACQHCASYPLNTVLLFFCIMLLQVLEISTTVSVRQATVVRTLDIAAVVPGFVVGSVRVLPSSSYNSTAGTQLAQRPCRAAGRSSATAQRSQPCLCPSARGWHSICAGLRWILAVLG